MLLAGGTIVIAGGVYYTDDIDAGILDPASREDPPARAVVLDTAGTRVSHFWSNDRSIR